MSSNSITRYSKALFIRLPKTAGTSIESIFRNYSEVVTPLVNKTEQGNKERVSRASAYREIIGNNKWGNLFTFTFVRNPYDRCVSLWQMFEPDVSFNSFVKKISTLGIETSNIYERLTYHCCLQSPHLTDDKGKIIVDFIGKFENLEEDYFKICKKIRLPKTKLPHKRKTYHKHYSKYYDNETKTMVTEIYKKDLEILGYDFERLNLIDNIKDELEYKNFWFRFH